MVDVPWYKNAVIYNLHADTFMDANGDGVGDFAGSMQRLEYLQRLGVDGLWLAPFSHDPRRQIDADMRRFKTFIEAGWPGRGEQAPVRVGADSAI